MDNLLPALTNIDVTSNQFRETVLPYQQWEVKRTHNTPSTPSDIGHLLPPLRVQKLRADSSGSPLPLPPGVEPSLPRPAPVERNVSDLYDPALDPSPIGREERGPVQPVRISRVLPRRELFPAGEDLRGVARLDENPVATLVTILNGYRTQSDEGNTSLSGDGWGSVPAPEEEGCVDIFVEGFSKGIDHATLLPAEIFCRVLQTGNQGPPRASSNISRETARSVDARGRHLGLTVYLARAGERLDAADGDAERLPNEQRHRCSTSSGSQNNNELAAEATITHMMFQREDGKPGPSRNAFRVQFEPGPLGIELEEYPGQRGIVQVRHVLQAGQAEQDGRLSAGCFVVAVGNWDGPDTYTPPPVTIASYASGTAIGGGDYGSLNTSVQRSNEGGVAGARINKRAMIRSLAEFEEAVSSRQPDRLFVVWALDRCAPEAVAALGDPDSDRERTAPHDWSMFASPINTWRGREEELTPDSGVHNTLDPSSAPILPRSYSQEGAPGWESGSAFASGKHSLEYSLSISEPGEIPHASTRASGQRSLRIGEEHVEHKLPTSAVGFRGGNAEGVVGSASGETHREGWAKRNYGASVGSRLEKGKVGATGGWEFETGGGIFDEDDQGIAPRTHPSSNIVKAHAAGPSSNEADEKPPPLPLGLQASAVDEFAVFIWFCNNHESATMNVSWIDYDGKRVPRRSLEPGGCYFERSFATHPWVVQYDERNQNGHHEEINQTNRQQRDEGASGSRGAPRSQHRPQALPQGTSSDGEYCIVRLGDAMALARLTGSLVWNPTGRTLSVTKQAKIGAPGMTAAACADIGSGVNDGARLDPGMKRLGMAAHQREAEEARARAGRAIVREEKMRILQEMKTWRTHPVGGVGAGVGGEGKTAEAAEGGLGQGVPNLRIVMIGSSGWNE